MLLKRKVETIEDELRSGQPSTLITKILFTVFIDYRGVVHHEFLPKYGVLRVLFTSFVWIA